MACSVDFSTRLASDFKGKTEEQKIDYLTVLFQDLVEEPEVAEKYPGAVHSLSERTFREAGKRAHTSLTEVSQIETEIKEDSLRGMLKNAFEYLQRINGNTQAFEQGIINDQLTASDVQRLVSDGVDLNNYQIYRLLFVHQPEQTLGIIQELCNKGCFPTEQNLCHLIAFDSSFTLNILRAFRPYKQVTFSKVCLGFSLRYSKESGTSIIAFLTRQGIEPTAEQIQFAHVHGTSMVRSKLKNACRTQHYPECHDGKMFFVRSGEKKAPFESIIDAILEQSDLSIPYILQYLSNGEKLEQEHLDYLIQRPITQVSPDQKDHTFEILRIFLMNGLAFSEKQWKLVIQGNQSEMINDNNLARFIRLHLIYKPKLGAKVVAALKEGRAREGSSERTDPVIKALGFAKTKPYICKSTKSLKSLAARYQLRAPGLFELLISSGIQPKVEHLKAYFNVPRDAFFNCLLDDPYFEANQYNQDLLDQAISMATGEVVEKMVKRGFKVNLTHVLNSFDNQRYETTVFLINHLKKISEPQEPVKFDADESIWTCLSKQRPRSSRILADCLSDGDIPDAKQIQFLRDNPTLFTPELLLEFERAGFV